MRNLHPTDMAALAHGRVLGDEIAAARTALKGSGSSRFASELAVLWSEVVALGPGDDIVPYWQRFRHVLIDEAAAKHKQSKTAAAKVKAEDWHRGAMDLFLGPNVHARIAAFKKRKKT